MVRVQSQDIHTHSHTHSLANIATWTATWTATHRHLTHSLRHQLKPCPHIQCTIKQKCLQTDKHTHTHSLTLTHTASLTHETHADLFNMRRGHILSPALTSGVQWTPLHGSVVLEQEPPRQPAPSCDLLPFVSPHSCSQLSLREERGVEHGEGVGPPLTTHTQDWWRIFGIECHAICCHFSKIKCHVPRTITLFWLNGQNQWCNKFNFCNR